MIRNGILIRVARLKTSVPALLPPPLDRASVVPNLTYSVERRRFDKTSVALWQTPTARNLCAEIRSPPPLPSAGRPALARECYDALPRLNVPPGENTAVARSSRDGRRARWSRRPPRPVLGWAPSGSRSISLPLSNARASPPEFSFPAESLRRATSSTGPVVIRLARPSLDHAPQSYWSHLICVPHSSSMYQRSNGGGQLYPASLQHYFTSSPELVQQQTNNIITSVAGNHMWSTGKPRIRRFNLYYNVVQSMTLRLG